MPKPMCNVTLTMKVPLAAKGYAEGIFCERLIGHRGNHRAEYGGVSFDPSRAKSDFRSSAIVQWGPDTRTAI